MAANVALLEAGLNPRWTQRETFVLELLKKEG
jgi:hypothetical protein